MSAIIGSHFVSLAKDRPRSYRASAVELVWNSGPHAVVKSSTLAPIRRCYG